MGITNVKGRFIHIAARQSPYPSTSRARFPVFDKYVPWEVGKLYLLHVMTDKYVPWEVGKLYLLHVMTFNYCFF